MAFLKQRAALQGSLTQFDSPFFGGEEKRLAGEEDGDLGAVMSFGASQYPWESQAAVEEQVSGE